MEGGGGPWWSDVGQRRTRPGRPGGRQNRRGPVVGCPQTVVTGSESPRDASVARVGATAHDGEGRLVASPATQGADLDTLARVVERVRSNIKRVIEGKPDVISLGARGAARRGSPADRGRAGRRQDDAGKSLARSIDCSVRRIQFTPDLLPSDVTGVSVFNQETREFEFRPGGVFANIVVGDEINRASPKTQSALLECMEERQVTVDNTTYHLDAAVHGDRDPEPDRDGGHLRPPRGPARPLHGAAVGGLPGRGRRDRDARLPHR